MLSQVARRRRRRGEGGFTLIELLVVIAVLAILATIVIFNVTGVANRGKSSACQTDVKTLQTAVDSAISDNGGVLPSFLTSSTSGQDMTVGSAGPPVVPSDLSALNTNGYIHSVPTSCTTFTLTTSTATQGSSTISVYTVTGS